MAGTSRTAAAQFPWDQRLWDHDLHDFSKRAIALRHAHPALRRGQFATLYSGDDIYAFARRLDDDRLVVIFNAGSEAAELDLDVGNLLPDGFLTDIWGGLRGCVSEEKLGGFAVPRAPPRSSAQMTLYPGDQTVGTNGVAPFQGNLEFQLQGANQSSRTEYVPIRLASA